MLILLLLLLLSLLLPLVLLLLLLLLMSVLLLHRRAELETNHAARFAEQSGAVVGAAERWRTSGRMAIPPTICAPRSLRPWLLVRPTYRANKAWSCDYAWITSWLVTRRLVEWAAALEMQQRVTMKAVLPLIAASADDFDAEVIATFGGVQALPDRVSKPTLEKVAFHLHETIGDGSTRLLRELMLEGGGGAEPTFANIVAALLKYQGIKLSYNGIVGVVGPCVARVHVVAAACLQRIDADGGDAALFFNPMQETFVSEESGVDD
jgi:hypothetical protein